jgi:hypothetical protein
MKRITALAICLLLLCACTGERSAVRKGNGDQTSPDGVLKKIHDTVLPEREPSAEDLLQEALTMLSNPDRPHDDTEIRTVLNRLLAFYPESKWRPTAESLLLFIDRQGEKMKETRQLYGSLKAQKTRCEESDSQCRLELARILQENEQLKKDLENLKNLEIELEQRNRVMR